MRKILVVANRTLCEQHLLDEIDRRRREGPVSVHVVVPASASPWRWAMANPDAIAWGPHEAQLEVQLDPTADARSRLDDLLETLAVAGVAATGEVAAANPVTAVDEVLAGRSVDEIIVSTLPQGISRWLRGDVVGRIRSRSGLPVTHVVPDDALAEA